jgi:hypothetical protein
VLSGHTYSFRYDRDPEVRNLVRLFCPQCARAIAWSKDSDLLQRIAVAHLRIRHGLQRDSQLWAQANGGHEAWRLRPVLEHLGQFLGRIQRYRVG